MIVEEQDGRAIGDFIDLCNEYYACVTFAASGLELEAKSLKKGLGRAGNPNPTLFISSQRPVAGQPCAGRVKLKNVVKNSRKNGPYSDLLHKSVLISMYADWEEYYRERIATQIGAANKSDVRCDLIGELRLIRNWIVHRRSRPNKELRKLKIIKWKLTEDEKFIVTGQMFEELMERINDQLFIFDINEGKR